MSKDYNGRTPRPFQSQADMLAHLRDTRYSGGIHERDASFQEWVVECLTLTPDEHTGASANGKLEAAMSTPAMTHQDPLGELQKATDVYHTTDELTADQRSTLYRSSSYERQRVQDKIARSTAQWPEENVKDCMRVEVPVDSEEGEEGHK
jgi:hypothetical protein